MSRLRPFTLLILCSVPAIVSAQSSPPYVIQGPVIVQDDGCAPDTANALPLADCITVGYTANSTIANSGFITIPRGLVEFDFPIVSNVHASYNVYVDYKVTVTATGMNPNEVTQQIGEAKLDGAGSATLRVPIQLDWGESVVTFKIVLGQLYWYEKGGRGGAGGPVGGVATSSNASVTCGKNNIICRQASWGGTGPAVSHSTIPSIVTKGLPVAFPGDGFLALVTPAAAFQLAFVPTTIVYAPMGNTQNSAGPKTSSFALTQLVGTNQQLVSSKSSTTGLTQDDKTSYSIGVSINCAYSGQGSDCKGLPGSSFNPSLSFSVSNSWDSSIENDVQETYGTTDAAITQDQLGVQFSVGAASGEPSLDKVTCDTQPFWQDEIIGVVNAQYAAWDYPGGPILQPLGNAALVAETVRKLDMCARTPEVAKCDSSNSTNPHCTPYADRLTSDDHYLMLSSQDCTDILSLDPFYAKRTQDTSPLNYRLLSDVSAIDPVQVSNTQTTIRQVTQSSGSQTTLKTTSTISNTLDLKAVADFMKLLGFNAELSTSSTTTNLFTTVSADSLQSQVTAQKTAAATNVYNDTYPNNAPIKFEQDLVFMGIAAQDTSMNLACPAVPAAAALAADATATVPAAFLGLPVVPPGRTVTALRKNGVDPEAYVIDSGYGYVMVRRPADGGATKALVLANHADAARRHTGRPLPAVPPATVNLLGPVDAAQILKTMAVTTGPVQNALKRLGP